MKKPSHRLPLPCLLIPCAALTLAACEDQGPDPKAMGPEVARRAATVVRSSAEAMKRNRRVETAVGDVGQGLDHIFGTTRRAQINVQPTTRTPAPVPAPPPPRPAVKDRDADPWSRVFAGMGGLSGILKPALTGTPGQHAQVATTPDDDLAASLDEAAAEIEDVINDRVLAPGNLVSSDASQATYVLKPEITCKALDTGTIDEDCADSLRKISIRIVLTRDGDGARLGFLLAGHDREPFALFVAEGRIAVELYLGNLKGAVAAVDRATGETTDLPDVLKGTVRASLTRDGVRKVSASLSILDMLEIVDSDEDIVFRTAATSPLLSFIADGDAGTIQGETKLGMTEILGTWDPRETGARNQHLRIVVGGLTGRTTFTNDTRQVALKGLGLGAGPSFLEVRGTRLVQIDLNELAGRSFDLLATFPGPGQTRFALTPKFDLAVAFKLAALAAEFSSPPPAHLLDETYRVTLDAAGGAGPAIETRDDDLTGEGQVKIAAGKLVIGSSKLPNAVTASAGQCITSKEVAPGAHPVLGSIAVTSCR